jgi:hypothetical protein
VRLKPYFATAQLPMAAKNATMTPDGIVALSLPPLLVVTRSGPQTAVTATATHIAVIAREAHTSRTISEAQPRSGTAPEGECECVLISTSFRESVVAQTARRIRDNR